MKYFLPNTDTKNKKKETEKRILKPHSDKNIAAKTGHLLQTQNMLKMKKHELRELKTKRKEVRSKMKDAKSLLSICEELEDIVSS